MVGVTDRNGGCSFVSIPQGAYSVRASVGNVKLEEIHIITENRTIDIKLPSLLGIPSKSKVPASTLVGGLLALSLVLVFGCLAKNELDRRPYRGVGLTDESISQFFSKYPKQNGNSTWIAFGREWGNNPDLAEKALQIFKNFNETLQFIYVLNVNNYDGLNFLNEYPQFAKYYGTILPIYRNATLVRMRFHTDPRVKKSLGADALFLEAMKFYYSLHFNENFSLPPFHLG